MSRATIEPGAEARVIKRTDAGAPYRVGSLVIIEDYLPADDEGPAGYFIGDDHGTFMGFFIPADHVEATRTAEQMDARKLPTAAQIVQFLGAELLEHGDTFSTNEVDMDAVGAQAQVYGETHDGLTFGFQVRVTGVWETDS